MRCRVCQGDADEDPGRGEAVCRGCGADFRRPPSSPPPSVPLPPGVVARETPDSLFIAVRWFHPLHLIPIALAITPCLGVVVFFGEFSKGDVHWTTYVLGLMPYIAFGLIGAYWTLAFLLNRTHVWVRHGRITVSQVPLPVRRARRIDAADVDQLFTQADYDKHGQLVSCDVCLFRRNGRWLRLVKNLTNAEQALFLEWAIERHLGIRDEPVAGELPKRPSP